MPDYKKFFEYWHDLYGTGLKIAGWHLNGELEDFDNFFDSAVASAASISPIHLAFPAFSLISKEKSGSPVLPTTVRRFTSEGTMQKKMPLWHGSQKKLNFIGSSPLRKHSWKHSIFAPTELWHKAIGVELQNGAYRQSNSHAGTAYATLPVFQPLILARLNVCSVGDLLLCQPKFFPSVLQYAFAWFEEEPLLTIVQQVFTGGFIGVLKILIKIHHNHISFQHDRLVVLFLYLTTKWS